MDPWERLRQILDSVAEHPLRVAASAMGVFWGTAAIVMMLSWGAGFQDMMTAQLSHFGRPLISMHPENSSSGFAGYRPGAPIRISYGYHHSVNSLTPSQGVAGS